MSKDEFIIIHDGKEIRRGPLRQSDQGQTRLPFGMRPGEAINSLVVIGGVLVFIFNTYGMIKSNGQIIKAHDELIRHILECQKNSDNYHSAVTSDQFECGQPINTNNKIKKIRNIINPDSSKEDT